MTYKKNPKDKGLEKITSELLIFEEKAIENLDQAKKKSEGDVKDSVEKLCDVLIVQHDNLKLVMDQQKNGVLPEFQHLIAVTKEALAEAQGW